MKIAVLMPYRNAEDTIADTVASLAHQTYHNFDLFAVDNGSTDESYLRLCRTFVDHGEQLRHLRCHDIGIVPTLNTGLFHILASNEYEAIARIDADDIWLPEKLIKQVLFLEDRPDISILGTQIYAMSEDGKNTAEYYWNPCKNEEITNCLLSTRNAIAHPSVIVRTSVYRRCGVYDDIYPFAEDYQFWLKCLKYYKFANLPDRLVKYRVKHNNRYNPAMPEACRDKYGAAIMASLKHE